MILFDTNVIIDAQSSASEFHQWASEQIALAVSGTGGGINAVSLAELYAGQPDSPELISDLRSAGILLLDVPSSVAQICGAAFSRYRRARRESGGGESPLLPLPDFFIGAHAEYMGWSLVTRDSRRIRTYFPSVPLIESPV